MITKPLFILQLILLAGLGTVFLLPKHTEEPAAGVALALPEYIGGWFGEDAAVSDKEHSTLGPETQFARKVYTNGQGDALFVSVVLAGHDMNTSIHRPERCLPAQGYTILDSRTTSIDLSPQPLSVTRLYNSRQRSPRGAPLVNDYSLDYYWFIGSQETTPSHFTRTLIDIRDRLLKGTVQRWAYVTVMSGITNGTTRFGRSEEETDKVIKDFIKQLVPILEKPGVAHS